MSVIERSSELCPLFGREQSLLNPINPYHNILIIGAILLYSEKFLKVLIFGFQKFHSEG